ncbi:hypothetical protein F4774DRAFT_399906 [Daldinia eschscholtzii]|nr:hypothetical protein F4774DRAFT_399906 [Daldinia eschscholtzii]
MASPNQMPRGYESRHNSRYIVEPTPENQKIYNEIRQTHERMRLQTHVASQHNLLPHQTAPSITSTIHSPTDEPGTPSVQDGTTQGTDRPRRQRGRRRGPLDSNTRLNTALKRKLKLACPHHRAKKITCDCHDFSRLEEGYQSSIALSSPSHGRSHDRNDAVTLTPIDRTWNTFGAGGAAMASSDQDFIMNDFIDLQSSIGNHEAVRSDVQQIVSGFDADSVHLDSAMLQVPGQTYHPGNDMGTQSPDGHVQFEYLEIGSQMQIYPNRWQCEYKGSMDTASETSSEACHWTGPFRELSNHFRTRHRPFHDVNPRFWLVCTSCRTRAQAPNDLESPLSPFRCTRESCSGSCQRWYYGSTRDESVAGSAITLTQSSESEAAFSWSFQPEGNQPWLGGGASNGGYGSYFGATNSHERSYYHSAKWETSSDSSISLANRINPLRKSLRPAQKDYTRCKLSRQCPVRLLPYAKLPVGYLLSIVIPLLTTIIRESSRFTESGTLPSRTIYTDAFNWSSVVLVLIGFMATWSLKDQAESRVAVEPHYQGRRRQRLRNPVPSDEILTRHHFSPPMTT